MKIEIIKCLQDNYSYLIIDEENQTACVVDPSESAPIINYLDNSKINLKFILNTHHHYDHVGGNLELKKKYNSKVVGFIGDKNRIPEIDISLEDNQIWKQDNFEAKIYHVPGHTSGHIAFHFFKEKKIFTGDTLFSLGCGRIFEGTYEQMYNSLKKIKSLPKDTEIYCSFAKEAGDTGCRMMNTAFYFYGLNKIYKSFSVDSIEKAVDSVRTLGIKGFAITMPYKEEVLKYVDTTDAAVSQIGAANTVINEDGRVPRLKKFFESNKDFKVFWIPIRIK